MYTRVFVDTLPGLCGYQLCSSNISYSPRGRIRVARFETAFDPLHGFGYYGDIYLRLFVRKWKRYVVEKKRKKMEIKMAYLCISPTQIGNPDIIRYIVQYI